MTTSPGTAPPSWPHCGEGADPADPVGCRGIRINSGPQCLEHMPDTDRTAYLATLSPGSDLDLRGTTIDEPLLQALRLACTDPSTGHPRFGDVDFEAVTFGGDARFESTTFRGEALFCSATFDGAAVFDSTTFSGYAQFESAAFGGDARFGSATFSREARFESAVFSENAQFGAVTFGGGAWFDSVTFGGLAGFEFVTFGGDARFGSATFSRAAWFESAAFSRNARFDFAAFNGSAWFGSTVFYGDAWFGAVVFEGLQHLGPLVCIGRAGFDGARFTGPQVTVEMAAREVSFDHATFAGSVVVRLRYAELQMGCATLAGPTAVSARPGHFEIPGGLLAEGSLSSGPDSPRVRLLSLDGVDAAQLVLTDIDLTACQFTGAFHLDQIQIGFGCTFGRPPAGWRRRGLLPARWSTRNVLAEEQHWRAQPTQPGDEGWSAGRYHGVPELGAGPEDLAGVYQQLRKAFEEAGNEPDAADFYYGEMEMRRHDRSRPRAERRLLWLYWLTAGYGLRASRALSWLVAAMGVTLLAMMLLGLPNDSPDPQTTGTYTAGTVKTVTKTPDPSLTLPLHKRVSVDRAEKATLVVVNSVVFRSSGQNLTLPGTVIEMASRIGEPVLLGLAALAVRSRVKR